MWTIIVLAVSFWIALYLYFTRKFNYWKSRNVTYKPPLPFFGNLLEVFTFQKSIAEFCRQLYESTTQPFVGFFICDEPYLLIRDVELIKAVLVKDFNTFNDRTMTENKKDDPMGSHILFILKNPDWKDLRRKITPVFTTKNMKWMYTLIQEVGNNLVEYLDKAVDKDPIIDVREVTAKYTTDAITSTAFGINANCFKNENAEFRVVSRKALNFTYWERAISTSFYFVSPLLVKLFHLKFVDTQTADFLRNAFWKTMREREDKRFKRNDLLDILIEIKKQEALDGDENKLEGDILVAQATQFFLAGYETSSSTISFALYELALQPDLQKKLRKEIVNVANKHDGEISYEALKEMEFLEMCVKESLRKYPTLAFLDRRCNEDYLVPGTDLVLKKGTGVFISNWGLHFDPKYYPEPEKYDPLRFSEASVKSRPQFTYLPFGEGPRNCIGARFGILSTKCGLAHILSKYEVELCNKTPYPLKLGHKGFLLAPADAEIMLSFKRNEELD